MPMRVTEEDLMSGLEASMLGSSLSGASYEISQLLSTMAAAAQNSLLEGCPVFINRLRNDPKLAQRIKKMMQQWGGQDEE